MSENWNSGVERCLEEGADAVAILADRRIATRHLLRAFNVLHINDADVVVFDHQTTWITTHGLRVGSNYQYSVSALEIESIERDSFNCYFDGYTPRLFNCITSSRYLRGVHGALGTYVGGSSPDINFQARLAVHGSRLRPRLLKYDAPGIITNSRHTHSSNGMNAQSSPKTSEFHQLSNPGYYPSDLEGLIVATCLWEISHESRADIERRVNWGQFFRHAIGELRFQRSREVFDRLQTRLIRHAERICNTPAIQAEIVRRIRSTSFSEPPRSRYDRVYEMPPTLELLGEIWA